MSPTRQNLQTILFADVAESAKLYDQLGDDLARQLIARCLDLLTRRTRDKRGKVVKTIGDEIMSTFKIPDQAVSAAILMHEEVTADDTLAGHHIQMRIGLHHGPVIEDADDIFGDAVNIAARMVGQAKAGQIITNSLTLDLLDNRYKSKSRLVDQTRIKGKKDPIDIIELSWGHPEELTMITTFTGKITGAADSADAALMLESKEGQCVVNHETPVVTIGRDATNSIVVIDPKVSRLHARVELRKDRFILIDQSTNGTHLLRADGQTALLRRDEITLPEQGVIGLGEKASADSALSIRFKQV